MKVGSDDVKDFMQENAKVLDTALHGGKPDGIVSKDDIEAAIQSNSLSGQARAIAQEIVSSAQDHLDKITVPSTDKGTASFWGYMLARGNQNANSGGAVNTPKAGPSAPATKPAPAAPTTPAETAKPATPTKARTPKNNGGFADPAAYRAITSVDPKKSEHRNANDGYKTYAEDSSTEAKKNRLIGALEKMGIKHRLEQSIYVNAAMTENGKLDGATVLGDNKHGESFNFGIYNMNAGQVADLKGLSGSAREQFVREFIASRTPKDGNLAKMAWDNVADDTKLFRDAIQKFGYDQMMTQHRGGSTSLTDLERGFKRTDVSTWQPVNYDRKDKAKVNAKILEMTGIPVTDGKHPDQYGAKLFLEMMKARTQVMANQGQSAELQSSGGGTGLLRGNSRFHKPIPHV